MCCPPDLLVVSSAQALNPRSVRRCCGQGWGGANARESDSRDVSPLVGCIPKSWQDHIPMVSMSTSIQPPPLPSLPSPLSRTNTSTHAHAHAHTPPRPTHAQTPTHPRVGREGHLRARHRHERPTAAVELASRFHSSSGHSKWWRSANWILRSRPSCQRMLLDPPLSKRVHLAGLVVLRNFPLLVEDACNVHDAGLVGFLVQQNTQASLRFIFECSYAGGGTEPDKRECRR